VANVRPYLPEKPIKIGVLMDVPERHYKYAFPIYD